MKRSISQSLVSVGISCVLSGLPVGEGEPLCCHNWYNEVSFDVAIFGCGCVPAGMI